MIALLYCIAISAVFITLLRGVWGKSGDRSSVYEVYALLCVAGGIYAVSLFRLSGAVGPAEAVLLEKWSVGSLIGFTAVLGLLTSRIAWPRRWPVRTALWMLIGATLIVVNALLPAGLKYESLTLISGQASVFGDPVRLYAGPISAWAPALHGYIHLCLIWSLYNAFEMLKGRRRDQFLLLGGFVAAHGLALVVNGRLSGNLLGYVYVSWVPLGWLGASIMIAQLGRVEEQKRERAQRVQMEDEIRLGIQLDELTGLPNHQGLISHLQHRLFADQHYRCALLFLVSVNDFKTVNAIHGHKAGDQILQTLAKRLKRKTHEDQFVARISGDCFAVVFPGKDESMLAEHTDGEVWHDRASLKEPITFGNQAISLEYRVGVVQMFPAQHSDPADALAHANLALAEARDPYKPNVVFYDDELAQKVVRAKRLEVDLNRAIEGNQLTLHFQPKVDATGASVGAEALMRWEHPVLGNISPAEFIPIAEQSGQMMRMGWWLFEESFRLLKLWESEGFEMQGRLALNISSWQIKREDFADNLLQLMQQKQVSAAKIEIELTESGLLENSRQAAQQLGKLRDAGVAVAIDDFGTGYSTLAYLGKLPIDVLKIDKSFVDALDTEKGSQLVNAMIDIGRAMRMSIVAEGVETEEQMESLKSMGCAMFQGYFYSRPLPESGFKDWSSDSLAATA